MSEQEQRIKVPFSLEPLAIDLPTPNPTLCTKCGLAAELFNADGVCHRCFMPPQESGPSKEEIMSEQGQKLTDQKSDGICISDRRCLTCGSEQPDVRLCLNCKRAHIVISHTESCDLVCGDYWHESELSSLRAEVERLRTTVEEREKLLDRFTANNIKLNQELEKLRTTVTALRGDHNHETCAHDLTYWYQFHGDCCTGCGGNLHLIHPLVNLYPHFTGACRAALSEARKEPK